MAKGSVRKKGKKWYGRFYIEDESGRKVQKEFAGTESKAETEAMLRKAIADYEEKQFVGKAENITVGDMLDMWVEEELKPGNLSNGTVMSYQGTVNRIKQYPIGKRKLKTVTADHLQAFIDFLSYGGTNPDGTTSKPMSKGYMLLFSAVLQNSFRFAVFPKKLITFNPMQYVKLRGRKQETDIFSDSEEDTSSIPTITHEQFQKLEEFLKAKDNPALLPVQIAYYTGLRIGEVCGLTWQDINLEEQYLTVRRSMRYNGTRHTTEVGTTKRSKVRTVDFCDTLAAILKAAKTEQHKNRFRYGELYNLNYYLEVKEKDRTYYRRTGGGLTLSGGESLCQPKFARDLLRAAKESGITTAMESMGCAPYSTIEEILPYLDQYLLDIKHMNPEKHKEFTGRSNELMLENAKKIADSHMTELSIRVPVIPGFNDTEIEIRDIAEYVRKLGNVRRMHLLPYHRLGQDKYDGLNRPYLMGDVKPPTNEKMGRLLKVAEEVSGVECRIGG